MLLLCCQFWDVFEIGEEVITIVLLKLQLNLMDLRCWTKKISSLSDVQYHFRPLEMLSCIFFEPCESAALVCRYGGC